MEPAKSPTPLPEKRVACSPAEAAELLGVSKASIHNWITAGQLASTKIGRTRLIAMSAIERIRTGNNAAAA